MIKTRQKIFLILGAIAVIVVLAWYLNVYRNRTDVEISGEPIKFVASIEPIRFLVTKIVGEDFDVTTLLPAGASPETYEPTGKQILNASTAKAIFTTGLIDFEKVIVNKMQANSSAETVILSNGITVIAGSCTHEDSEAQGGHNHGIDPHIWSSPKALKIMAGNIYRTVSAMYPDSLKYRDNYLGLISQLNDTDRTISNKISSSGREYFIIYHPALTYYSADYNITQVALEYDGKEPSIAYLKPIIDKAREDSIEVILYQKHLNPLIVESIAEDIGAVAVEFDPLAGNVIENLLRVTDILTQ